MMQVPGCGEAAIAKPLAGTVIRFCSCSGRLFPPASLARKHCCHTYKECHSRPPAYACQMGDKHGGHILAFKWRGGHSRRAAHMLQMSRAFIRVACEGRGDLGPHAGCMTHIATSASIHLGPPMVSDLAISACGVSSRLGKPLAEFLACHTHHSILPFHMYRMLGRVAPS